MAITTGAAILGAAVLGGVSQAGATRTATKAAESGAAAQQAAAEAGITEQRAAREAFEARTQPFVDIGLQAGGQLQNLLADPTQGLEQINPIVDFLRNQGFEQIQESAAAQGRLGAGGTLQDLTRFNTQLGATIVPQLQNQRFNQLFNLFGAGQSAAVGQGQAALGTGANIGNLLGNVGQAQAGGFAARGQGALGQSAALTGTLQNVAGTAGAFPNLFGAGTPPSRNTLLDPAIGGNQFAGRTDVIGAF